MDGKSQEERGEIGWKFVEHCGVKQTVHQPFLAYPIVAPAGIVTAEVLRVLRTLIAIRMLLISLPTSQQRRF